MSIKSNSTRSLLTMLGIIIGVGAVILMLSVGRSFESYILDQIDSFGGNVMDVYPKGLEKFGQSLDTVTINDYEATTKLTSVDSIAPVIFIPELVQFGREEESVLIFGTTKEIFDNYGLEIEKGRLLTDQDIKRAKSVAVVSYNTAESLFGSKNPIDKSIKIGSRHFTVVGVLKSVGSLMLQDLDEPVYVPFTAARSMMDRSYLDYISMQAIGDDELARSDVTALLRQRHKINNPDDDPDKDDFLVRSAAQAAGVIGTVALGITLFLSIVAGISLLVGGIGIMNIMLVAVSERTPEIGLRKAVGAKKKDILLQFLIESVVLTLIGGAIGIIGSTIIGILLSNVAEVFLGEFPFSFSVSSLILAVLMAGGTGIVFGLYPAKHASDLNPMEAMRYE
ncbi:FtsX-like permease family protein [Candidatus Peribacteria bacterium]|jgi:putative ABC transport system permease protein|nr:FtsX-like permease family protein [Candidatus Peribacteria bacterium]